MEVIPVEVVPVTFTAPLLSGLTDTVSVEAVQATASVALVNRAPVCNNTIKITRIQCWHIVLNVNVVSFIICSLVIDFQNISCMPFNFKSCLQDAIGKFPWILDNPASIYKGDRPSFI